MLWKGFNARMRAIAASYSVAVGIGVVRQKLFDNGIAMNVERVRPTDWRLINNRDRNCCRSARVLRITNRVLEAVRTYIPAVRNIKDIPIAIVKYRAMRRHSGKRLDEKDFIVRIGIISCDVDS